MFEYKIISTDGKARTGEFVTPHGILKTPMFMPVGTHGAVKGLLPRELEDIGTQLILGNTYHLYLRPGDALIHRLGGLHSFMQWTRPILTDSGGFQVFSLGERGMAGNTKKALRSVAEEGITFRSHLDGSRHLFTPEVSIGIQQNLGSDIMMAFDQPVYGMSDDTSAGAAMERSMRWLVRSKTAWQSGNTSAQALFGIVQGGTHTALHRRSAEFVAAEELPGNAIGGLSVGEGKDEMWSSVESINELLPINKPRYFMGLGEPRDLVDAVLRGVDMFDCVSPTRLARHGAIWMPVGPNVAIDAFWNQDTDGWLRSGLPLRFERWNLHSAKFRENPAGLRPGSGYSLATLRHYVIENEIVAVRVLSLHNVEILHRIVQHAVAAIQKQSIRKIRDLIL